MDQWIHVCLYVIHRTVFAITSKQCVSAQGKKTFEKATRSRVYQHGSPGGGCAMLLYVYVWEAKKYDITCLYISFSLNNFATE